MRMPKWTKTTSPQTAAEEGRQRRRMRLDANFEVDDNEMDEGGDEY